MRQGNQNLHIVDGEEAWLAMKHPLIPVLINLVSECDDITLFKTQLPFILRFKVVQSSAAGLIHWGTWKRKQERRTQKDKGYLSRKATTCCAYPACCSPWFLPHSSSHWSFLLRRVLSPLHAICPLPALRSFLRLPEVVQCLHPRPVWKTASSMLVTHATKSIKVCLPKDVHRWETQRFKGF